VDNTAPSPATEPAVTDLLGRLESLVDRLVSVSALRPLAVEKDVLAKLLSCSERQIDRKVSAGEMPKPIKFGTQKTVWVLATIEAWLAAGCPDVKTFDRLRCATARR
jgi:predicted DNA-binding transcriptional regulator AlpA